MYIGTEGGSSWLSGLCIGGFNQSCGICECICDRASRANSPVVLNMQAPDATCRYDVLLQGSYSVPPSPSSLLAPERPHQVTQSYELVYPIEKPPIIHIDSVPFCISNCFPTSNDVAFFSSYFPSFTAT